MNNLKISIVPLDITWTDVDENLFVTENILRKIDKDTDIVVLPELFSTGFIGSRELLYKFAEDYRSSQTLDRIRSWAKNYNFAIAGSLLINEKGNFYNRAFFVEPSGESAFYDKKHLFSLSSEARDFTPGSKQIPVIRFRGWNIALAVCYELRFPAWLRNTNNKYDVLLMPANWPAKRSYAWEHLLIARAIENQAYVIGANRSGKDDSGEYDDLSFIFNYLGKPIHISSNKLKGVIYADLDLERMRAYRTSFPVEKDADNFQIQG